MYPDLLKTFRHTGSFKGFKFVLGQLLRLFWVITCDWHDTDTAVTALNCSIVMRLFLRGYSWSNLFILYQLFQSLLLQSRYNESFGIILETSLYRGSVYNETPI